MTLYYYTLNGILCSTTDIKHIPPGILYETIENHDASTQLTLGPGNTAFKDLLFPFQKQIKDYIDLNKNQFLAKANAPYLDANGVYWNGGQSSISTLLNLIQTAQILGQTTISVYDLSNTAHSLTVSQTQNLAAQMQSVYQTLFQSYQSNKTILAKLATLAYWKPNTAYSTLGTLICDYSGAIWSNQTTGTSSSNYSIFEVTSPSSQTMIVDASVEWVYVKTLSEQIAEVQQLLGIQASLQS